jgi:hypothetical protein
MANLGEFMSRVSIGVARERLVRRVACRPVGGVTCCMSRPHGGGKVPRLTLTQWEFVYYS